MNVRRLSAHQKTVCAPFWGEANRQRPQNGANCDALISPKAEVTSSNLVGCASYFNQLLFNAATSNQHRRDL